MINPLPMRILVLEDQGLVRAGMRELIHICEPHSEIHEASSYEEAVEKLTDNEYQIAFLDIDLKGERSGIDVLRFLRAQDIDTRAIMLSGRSEREVVMECIQAGASGYILKDMDADGLFRRALDAVFQGTVFLPSTVLGRGGYSPSPSCQPVSVETLGLSPRAIQVLYYLCQGMPNKVIATRMGIEEATVRKDYVPQLFRAFKVARRTELVVEISRRGISIPAPPSTAAQKV